MAIEIERKFLVRGRAFVDLATHCAVMDQGYLGGDRCSVRVRIEGDAARLNIKSRASGIRRLEFEVPLPLADAHHMLDELAGALVRKTRYFVTVQSLCFEIDVFHGDNEGLIVAEVELEHENEAIPELAWLGREVSDDPRYYNLNLVENPFAHWPDREEILKELAC